MKLIAALLLGMSISTGAFAQNCRAMPAGPDRRACIEQRGGGGPGMGRAGMMMRGGGGPGMRGGAFGRKGGGRDAKMAYCRQRVIQLGGVGRGGGGPQMMRACMEGRI